MANAVQGTPFALTPATLNDAAIIDYRTTEGKELYKAAVKPLATKYDGNPDKILQFLRDVAQHAQESNWDPILQVENNNGEPRNLLESYDELTEANVRAHAMNYITGTNRNAQLSMQMFNFLFYSIEGDLRNRVSNEPGRYTIEHTVNGTNHTYQDGPLFLKAITVLVCIDSASRIANLYAQLHALDTYMRSKLEQCDIEKFNRHVRDLRHRLANNQEHLSNPQLNMHLFHGYCACSDHEFVNFMTNVKNQILYQNATYSPDEIMTLAVRFYTDRKRQGLWNKLSPEQEQIIALKAKLKALQSKKQGNGKQDTDKCKRKERPNVKEVGNKKRACPTWVTTPPSIGEQPVKQVKEKTFYWCPQHKKWALHHPKDCKGINILGKNADSDDVRQTVTTISVKQE